MPIGMSAEPPPAEGNSPKGGNDPPDKEDHYRPIVAAIKALKEQKATDNKQNGAYQKKSLFWSKVTAGWVGTYTILTLVLVLISKCNLDTSRESFTAVQRAFIVVDELRQEAVMGEGDQRIGWRFTPTIQNSGNTPAIGVSIVALTPNNHWEIDAARRDRTLRTRAWQLDSPGDPDEVLSPTEMGGINEAFIANTDLGPHGNIYPIPTIEDIFPNSFDVNLRGLGVFYYGSVHYKDVFDGQHVTKYCFALGTSTASIGHSNIPKTSPARCRHWNCADTQDCERDKQEYMAQFRWLEQHPSAVKAPYTTPP
jgi:hypothetical protein